jgi:vitamin B12 transporter
MKKNVLYSYLIPVLILVIQNHAFSMIVKGRVTSKSGEPIVYVNVFFPDDLSGDVTDEKGKFEITTQLTGEHELAVTHIGYKKVCRHIQLIPGMADIMIEMEKQVIELQNVAVSASSFTMSEDEGVTLSAMDVVSTAGAAADIMRAIQTFAGVTTVDDGAGLFVRGGDVQETQVLLDGGILKHPYKYESTTGGYFGTFSPFLLAGTFFSSGAFSAKYGNALSGVLAMESLGMPDHREYNLGLGLAATSFAMHLPVIKDRFGIRFSGNKSVTDLLFRLNGASSYFSTAPVSDDGNISLHYRYSKQGIVKFFIFLSRNRIGVKTKTPDWKGFYDGVETNQLYVLNWRHTMGQALLLQGTLATNRFANDQRIGVLDLDTRDRSGNFSLDLEYRPRTKLTLLTGVSHQIIGTRFSGIVPRDPNDITGTGEQLTFAGLTKANISSAYAEGQLRAIPRLLLVAGVRMDHHHQVRGTILDPRFSLVWQINPQHAFKLSGGVYHQFPDMYYYDEKNGNRNLLPCKAVHTVMGWEYQRKALQVHLEAYYKWYDDLILEDERIHYSNLGEGYARGVDIFIKRDAGLVTGWVTYSYLQSKRKEELYHELVPTNYDITHNFKVAAKLNISSLWGVSVSTRYSSGCPYHTGYGQWNAARGPAYFLTDLSVSRLFSFFKDNITVCYLSVGNVFGRENIVRYSYSSDYNEVYKQKSYLRRIFYFGCSFNF